MTAAGIDEVLGLYERWGDDAYDETISQREHALQTAALAVRDGAHDELVAASLLHDVGHLLALDRHGDRVDVGIDLQHEEIGAAWLRPLLGAGVTAPIALHVRAKRYLVAADDRYRSVLSPASTRSLEHQGGPMSPDERAAFISHVGAPSAVRLRRWDDMAKLEDVEVPPIETYVDLLRLLAGG